MRPCYLFLLSCCLALSCALSAQKYTPKSVSFSGYPDSNSSELLAASGLKSGQPVGKEEMDAAALQLSNTGVFSDVRYSFNGTDLHFTLKPATGMAPVFFENFPWWDAKSLTTLLEARVPLFHGTVVPESGLQAQIAASLTALLAERGLQATVTPSPRVDMKTSETLGTSFRIESPPVLLGEVNFTGQSAAWTEQLSAIQKAAAGTDFSASNEATLSTAIRNIYHRQGYLDVSMSGFRYGPPQTADGKILVPVSAAIDEGAQYHLASLTLSGDVLVTPEEFDKRARIHAGDIANEDLLRQTLSQVSGPYRAKGYLRATIKAKPDLDPAQHTVRYSIAVVPGDVYHMGKLDLVNIDDEKKAIFLKTWALHEGDVYDATYPPSFLIKNVKTLSKLEGLSAGYKQYEHEDTHVVDLVVTFQRGGPLQKVLSPF